MRFIYLFFILLLISCKKYLDKVPDTSYAYPTTIENLQALLDNSEAINEIKTPGFSEASADDYFVTESIYNNLDQKNRQAYIWDKPVFSEFNDWRMAYEPVYVANICLENIDKIPRTTVNQVQWDNIKGSAYFIRAYYFLQLAWTYSNVYDSTTSKTDLGIVLRKTTDINAPSIRASVEESYRQIVEDATLAAQYLPDFSNHPLRPSKWSAYGLLARIYWSMRDYEDAYKYADKCLLLRKNLINYSSDDDVVFKLDGDKPPFKRYNKETIYYTETFSVLAIMRPTNALIDSGLYSTYEQGDLRKLAYFKSNLNYYSFKGTYSQDISTLFSGLSVDEILLIRSECNVRRNEIEKAMEDLNWLRRNRWDPLYYFPLLTNSKAKALELILIERRKELLMRNLRWIDIKRLNKEGLEISIGRKIGNQIYNLKPNDPKFALPIPEDIIQLTGMPQNPR